MDTVEAFICGACNELLFEPLPLPCGGVVCSRCFRLPKASTPAAIVKTDPTLERPCELECQRAVSCVGAYSCPSKDCKLTHRYRNESSHTLINHALRKLFPIQQKALGLAKKGEELFCNYRRSISPEQSSQESCGILSLILNQYLNPSIEMAPFLQLPYILRSKVLAEMGHFKEARLDSKTSHEINPSNKRGVISEKFVGFMQEMNGLDNLRSEKGCSILEMRLQLRSACQAIVSQVNQSKSRSYLSEILKSGISSLSVDDFDCQLCLDPLCDVITTPCGHTYCRNCLLSSLDQNRLCPLCRQTLPAMGFFINKPADKSVSRLMLNFFDKLPISNDSCSIFAPQWIPIYHSPLLFPGSESSFHICETQHRVISLVNLQVMIKRIIETNGLFGVMLPPCVQSSVLISCGTLVRITGFEPLLSCDIVGTCDGNLPRYVVRVIGVSRFKIDQIRISNAGFHEGLATRIEDLEVDAFDGEWNPRELEDLVARSRTFVKSLFASIPPSARDHIQKRHGQMPLDPCDLSFWLAEFLPMNPYTLYQVMPLEKVCDRLRLLNSWMEATTRKQQSAC